MIAPVLIPLKPEDESPRRAEAGHAGPCWVADGRVGEQRYAVALRSFATDDDLASKACAINVVSRKNSTCPFAKVACDAL